MVPGGAGETVTQLTTRAASLNSERVVLVAPGETAQDGGARVAAALAGAICGEADPRPPHRRGYTPGDRQFWPPGTVRARWTPSSRGA